MQGFLLVWNCLFWKAVPRAAWYPKSKFRNQYLSHTMPNLGGIFLTLGHCDVCARLDQMDLENKIIITCCLLPCKVSISPNFLMWPFNFEGDGLHLIGEEKKTNFWKHLICQPQNILCQSLHVSNICGKTKMVMRLKWWLLLLLLLLFW